ncbi:MAG: hypothetical protein J6M41_04200 [Prevotella sp.]|nr:hypothetical protein [Prevotella sp.]
MKSTYNNSQLRLAVTLLLCYIVTMASAQDNVKRAFDKFINSKKVEVVKSFSEERDIKLPNRPLVSKADVYTFTIKAKDQKLISEVIAAFEKDRNNENVYQVLNHTGGHGIPTNGRELLVGSDRKNSVYIGMQEMLSWQLMCLLDPADASRTHRYAYAIEWNDDPKARQLSKKIRGKLVVTYSVIPEDVLNPQKKDDAVEYIGHVETDTRELAKAVAGMALSGNLDQLNADKGQMLMAFDALKTEYCKTKNLDSQTGGTIIISLYALCSHIGNLMKDYPQTNDANLRELLQSQIDDMIRVTNHSSDLGRSHIGYLELAKKALE